MSQETSGDNPLAQFGEGDIGIVNYALTLEYLEAAFYADVIKSGLFRGQDLALIKEIGRNEQEHVTALTAAVKQAGAQPAPKPKTKFPLDSAESVLELAATVENLGAAAYLGQAAAIKDKAILASALAIHSVEGRHAAALNVLTGKPATDTAFAEPADADHGARVGPAVHRRLSCDAKERNQRCKSRHWPIPSSHRSRSRK